MRLLCILILTLATGPIARAAPEPPLIIDAYATQRDGARDATLTIVVFVAVPVQVIVHVTLPAGWSGANDWAGVVSSPELLTYQLHATESTPPGLGTIRVTAEDDRGRRAERRVWVRAPGEVARSPVGARVAVVKR